MRLYRYILLLFYVIFFISDYVFAQSECYFEHYSTEDGLPQNNITDILQDKKGFMWFATWNGLSRFDGHEFKTIEFPLDGSHKSISNRIDNIYEDKYGHIWTLVYDKTVYRYNPKSDEYMGINSLNAFNQSPFSASKIIPQQSGKVWLISNNNGCVCITDSLFNAEIFNTRNNRLLGDSVYDIYEDKNLDNWILTNKGVVLIDKNNNQVNYLNTLSHDNSKKDYPVFCAIDFDDEIWFGSRDGEIWIYKFDNNRIRQLKIDTQSSIRYLKRISKEKIVAITENDGFLIYSQFNKSWEKFNKSSLDGLVSNIINSCYVDLSENLWLETDQAGVSKFNSRNNSITHFEPFIETSEANVFLPNFFIFEDINQQLWVHPRGGGFGFYDQESNRLVPFYNEPLSEDWRFSNVLHSAYSDRQGNLWIGTRTHGLEKITFFNKSFKSLLTSEDTNSTVNNDVRPIFQDKSQKIWIGTKDGKIHLYDQNLKKIGFLNKNGEIGQDDNFKGVAYCITEDSKSNIWIGTKGEGVYKLTPKGDHSFNIVNFKKSTSDKNSLSDNNIYSIFEDKKGRIWIGTYGGGINLVEEGHNKTSFVNHRNQLSQYPITYADKIRIISSDNQGNIFVGTTLGLLVFSGDFDTYDEIDFRYYFSKPDEFSLKANDIFDIYTTEKGTTYIATFGGGISKVIENDRSGFPQKFKNYSTKDGLTSNVTLSILEDSQNILWICTESNISRFDPHSEAFESFSEIKRIMKHQSFSEASRCLLMNGKVLFGNSKGFLNFDPNELSNNTFNPYLALLEFKLFNRKININPKGPLKANIDDIKNLTLKYNQNFFSIEFAGLDFEEPDNISYSYMLEEFDKEWIYNNKQRSANYTNLSPGKYVFKVRSTNSNGIWSNNERSLAIKILPPIWRTWWAYLIYIVLILTTVYLSLRLFLAFYKIRQQAELEHRETELKTKFFTDISHEIRTPLTMIVSPVDNIIQDDNTPDNIRRQLALVSKNTGRLLTMVNQILDFRKIEKKAIELSRIEIGLFVEEICESFEKLAEKENIDFIVENEANGQEIWADPDAIEKIMINLLSNAFKYTPANKTIKVRISNHENHISIRVEDEGIGISREKISRLFKRFESFNEDKSKPSTGIGLSIVKELIDKHSAKIFVESEPDKGSIFLLEFAKGTKHFKSDVIINDTTKKTEPKPVTQIDSSLTGSSDRINDGDEKLTILVVEDDDDLRSFIVTALESEYNIEEAANGREGLEKVLEIIPDFIISDIMMPEMDGIELLRKVRGNINTSHILFLLLTAKTTADDILKGLESGTDEYLSKPFSIAYLQARIRNLINRRKSIQKYYRNISNHDTALPAKDADAEDTTNLIINEQDDTFVKMVTDFIKQNMGNNDYVVEDIVVDAGMSRTVFYKKLKGLTGLSPVEFKRDILLNEAAILLKTNKYNVKEVAYKIGFADNKYFTKCFKTKFGMTPSEFILKKNS